MTRALAVAVVMAGALARVASAQPRAVGEPPAAASTPPEVVAQARDHYQKGLTHFDLKEYADALVEFKNAYRLVQDPPLLFNIAQCHRRLGQNAEALDFYRNYLRRAPHSTNRAEVERRIREIERELPVDAKPATGLGTDKTTGPGKGQPPAATAPATPRPVTAPPPAAKPVTSPPPATSPPPPAMPPPPAPPPAAKPAEPAAPPPGVDLRASAETPPAAAESKPIYKKWWFWTGLGVLAIGAVAVVAIARRGEIGDCSGLDACITVEKGK